MYIPCEFPRQEYLAYSKEFESKTIDNADSEVCEFSGGVEDLAFELSYTRYYLAKAEKLIEKLTEDKK